MFRASGVRAGSGKASIPANGVPPPATMTSPVHAGVPLSAAPPATLTEVGSVALVAHTSATGSYS